ncbi:hypothetical protein [Anabaena lutea]|uniref:Ribbon-helix-helix protein CopG domain-containing protein n=1 Tax=Anabaena lutea FACHB-196 TaxID=2692881 RepID=A0ABR8F9I1_9NOST|nr:hypothetical protein [Anabaena lutea]MBD2566414.1 hypothetical protein [Anabaena lutea FACHB-196]
MTTKVVGLRLEAEVIDQLDKLCQESGKSRVEVVTQLISKAVNSMTSQDNSVNKSVCSYPIGAKLPIEWELKVGKYKTQKVEQREFLVFPDDRVVAFWNKSLNGNRKWLEVAKVYPDAVWEIAKPRIDRDYAPITALEEALALWEAKENHPSIIKAKVVGWSDTKYQRFGWDLQDAVEAADEFLAKLEASAPLPDNRLGDQPSSPLDNTVETGEPLEVGKDATVPQISQDTPDPTEKIMDTLGGVPRKLTKSALVERLAKTPKEAKHYETQLKSMRRERVIREWTAERDPDGLSWIPTDDTREFWTPATAIATAKA